MGVSLKVDSDLSGSPFLIFRCAGNHRIQFDIDLLRYTWWVNKKSYKGFILKSTKSVDDLYDKGFWRLDRCRALVIGGVDGMYRPFKVIDRFQGLSKIKHSQSNVRVIFKAFRFRDVVINMNDLRRDRLHSVHLKRFFIFWDGDKVLLLELIPEGSTYDTFSS